MTNFDIPEDLTVNEEGFIHRAILAVVAELPTVEKNGTMTLGSNTVAFTRIDDIRDALNPILLKHGIVSYPRVLSKKTRLQVAKEPMSMVQQDPETKMISSSGREIRDGKIPTTRSWAEVEYEIRFVFVGDNSEVIATAAGQSYDSGGDKALAKATTAAIKRIIFETFKITDRTEGDDEERDADAGNRSATTDRREGGDRGQQHRTAAQTGQATGSTRRSSGRGARPAAEPAQPSEEAVSAADEATGEVPDEPQAPPAETELDKQKARLRQANATLGLSPAEVDAIATDATGKKTRPEWLTKPTLVKKVADALEAKVANNG